jgi:hypothetical protein
MSERRVWGDALRLEELIIDDLNPLSELPDLFSVGYSVASSTEPAMCAFHNQAVSFQALEVEIYGVASPLQTRNQCRAQRRDQ